MGDPFMSKPERIIFQIFQTFKTSFQTFKTIFQTFKTIYQKMTSKQPRKCGNKQSHEKSTLLDYPKKSHKIFTRGGSSDGLVCSVCKILLLQGF